MATTTITKNEFKILLNNGTTTAGGIRTLTNKIFDLQATTVTDTVATALDAVVGTLTPLFSKSIYDSIVVTTAQVHN